MSLASEQFAQEASGTAMTATCDALKIEEAGCDYFSTSNLEESYDDALDVDSQESDKGLSPDPEDGMDQDESPSGSGANKRKEVMTLPLPPGTLPPRKRAKTKDEKEQRRIERIMRNRQAAHASREKKRKHVEELETKCVKLTATTNELTEQLKQAQRAQVQAQEQHFALRNRLEQLEAAVQLARTSGDVSVLESALTSTGAASLRSTSMAMVGAQPTTVNDTELLTISPSSTTNSIVNHFAVPELDAPQLTHSASSSPQALDEDIDSESGLDLSLHTFGQTIAFPDNFSKTHHPAVMV